MNKYDVIIVGAGAAGLMTAGQLYKRKKSVLIIDMGDKPARKIEISGGGRCNFTNMRADYTRYFGKNPRFVQSALSQWSPNDTLNWVKSHNIDFIEKEPGRYFCKNTANDVINALVHDIGKTKIKYNTTVTDIIKNDDLFVIKTNNGDFLAGAVIVATGGMSYSHLGVSDIGYIIAKQFGHKIEPIRPALNAIKTNAFNSELSGISLPVEIKVGKHTINDDLLFTHFGLGGPAIYRVTLYSEKSFTINFAPNTNMFELMKNAKQTNGKKCLINIISTILPNKLARFLCADESKNIADYKDSELKQIADKIHNFEIVDAKTCELQTAEVTYGGVATDNISSKTMESKLCMGLFFVGETMDITGDLGGFNLQWAFSSGFVAGINA